jgi:hypothetical protein
VSWWVVYQCGSRYRALTKTRACVCLVSPRVLLSRRHGSSASDASVDPKWPVPVSARIVFAGSPRVTV